MGITESYITILDESLDKKIELLDTLNALNVRQTELLDREKFDEEGFHGLNEKKAELIDKLNAMDDGFQLIYDKVKGELDGNRNRYAEQIKMLQGKISQIMEKSNHLMAEEQRNKERIKNKFTARRKEISSVKKNSRYAANYYKTMNKVTTEPVFMDKKK